MFCNACSLFVDRRGLKELRNRCWNLHGQAVNVVDELLQGFFLCFHQTIQFVQEVFWWFVGEFLPLRQAQYQKSLQCGGSGQHHVTRKPMFIHV